MRRWFISTAATATTNPTTTATGTTTAGLVHVVHVDSRAGRGRYQDVRRSDTANNDRDRVEEHVDEKRRRGFDRQE